MPRPAGADSPPRLLRTLFGSSAWLVVAETCDRHSQGLATVAGRRRSADSTPLLFALTAGTTPPPESFERDHCPATFSTTTTGSLRRLTGQSSRSASRSPSMLCLTTQAQRRPRRRGWRARRTFDEPDAWSGKRGGRSLQRMVRPTCIKVWQEKLQSENRH
jgi:hypothetical protein